MLLGFLGVFPPFLSSYICYSFISSFHTFHFPLLFILPISSSSISSASHEPSMTSMKTPRKRQNGSAKKKTLLQSKRSWQKPMSDIGLKYPKEKAKKIELRLRALWVQPEISQLFSIVQLYNRMRNERGVVDLDTQMYLDRREKSEKRIYMLWQMILD